MSGYLAVHVGRGILSDLDGAGDEIGHLLGALEVPALVDPEIGVAGQGGNGVRDVAVGEILAVFFVDLGRFVLEGIELGQVFLIIGILWITGHLLELFRHGQPLVDRSLVPDDALDVGIQGVLVVGELGRVLLEELGRLFGGPRPAIIICQVGIGRLDEPATGVLGDESPERRRIGLAAERGFLSQLEFGGLGVGDGHLQGFVCVAARLPFGIEGDDLLVELLGLGRQIVLIAAGALPGQLEDDLDVGRLLGVALDRARRRCRCLRSNS